MKTQQVHTVTQFRCFGQIWKLLEPMHITTEKDWEVEAYYCFDRSREVYGSSPSDRSEDVIPTVMNDLGLNLYGVCEAYIYPKDFHEGRWENQQVLESRMKALIGDLSKAIEAGRKWLLDDKNDGFGEEPHPFFVNSYYE